MSERAANLINQLKQANDDVIGSIESLSDDQWQKTTGEEGWTVAATAHHIAATYPAVSGLIQMVAAGHQMEPISMDMIDQGNAQHAREFAACDRNETIALLRNGFQTTASMIEGFADEQLDQKAQVLQGAPEMTTEQLIQGILIGHAQIHGKSIKDAV